MVESSSKSFLIKQGTIHIHQQRKFALNADDIVFSPLFSGCKKSSDGICQPEIEDNQWQDCDEKNLIGGKSSILMEQSYMFCLNGVGMIYVTEHGQLLPDLDEFLFEKQGTKASRDYIDWLKTIEAPAATDNYLVDDITDERIAIRPHNSNDGYVTIGYGIALQSDKLAQKYGFTTGRKQSIGVVVSSIQTQIKTYGSDTNNPAILTFADAEDLLLEHLESYEKTADRLMNESGNTFTQNEKDAIISLVYNGNRSYDPDSLLYHLLRKDDQGAIEVLRKADEKGWYEDSGGLLRRRLMEYNIFFNNDYEFYEDTRLDELKTDVGF